MPGAFEVSLSSLAAIGLIGYMQIASKNENKQGTTLRILSPS